MRRFLLLCLLVLAAPLSAQVPTCTSSKTTRVVAKGTQWVGGVLKTWYVSSDSVAGTCSKFPSVTVHDTVFRVDTVRVVVHDTVAPTPPPPPPVDTTPPAVGSYPPRPATYTKVLAEFSGSCPVPAGSAYELAISGCAPWTIVGNANVSQVDDATDPGSPPKVWRVTMPAGGGGCTPAAGENGCATGTGSSTGYGRWGLPINSATVYASVWVKYSPNFWFQQVSQKFLRLDMAGASQGSFLIQASHNGDYLRSSDENAGIAYDPTITTQPTRGVWHQVEVLLIRGKSIQVWLDGQLRVSKTGNIAPTGNFTTFELHSEMGGGSFRLLSEQWFQIGHVLVAGQ